MPPSRELTTVVSQSTHIAPNGMQSPTKTARPAHQIRRRIPNRANGKRLGLIRTKTDGDGDRQPSARAATTQMTGLPVMTLTWVGVHARQSAWTRQAMGAGRR